MNQRYCNYVNVSTQSLLTQVQMMRSMLDDAWECERYAEHNRLILRSRNIERELRHRYRFILSIGDAADTQQKLDAICIEAFFCVRDVPVAADHSGSRKGGSL
jgi:hypothetical protein